VNKLSKSYSVLLLELFLFWILSVSPQLICTLFYAHFVQK
jgi:hypothetical protein